MRFEVVGNIASGKTTLAGLISGHMVGVLENFRQNPFWESFYENPKLNAFETELTFTLQHYHAIKNQQVSGSDFMCDFSLVLDQSYADVTLNGNRHTLYCDVMQELCNELGPPEKIIHLLCPENVLLDRIRARGRVTENSISLEYLLSLTESINRNMERLAPGTEVISIDTGAIDFAHDKTAMELVKELMIGN